MIAAIGGIVVTMGTIANSTDTGDSDFSRFSAIAGAIQCVYGLLYMNIALTPLKSSGIFLCGFTLSVVNLTILGKDGYEGNLNEYA